MTQGEGGSVGHEDSRSGADETTGTGGDADETTGTGGDADETTGTWGDALRASEQRFGREFGRAPLGLVAASLRAGQLAWSGTR